MYLFRLFSILRTSKSTKASQNKSVLRFFFDISITDEEHIAYYDYLFYSSTIVEGVSSVAQ